MLWEPFLKALNSRKRLKMIAQFLSLEGETHFEYLKGWHTYKRDQTELSNQK